MAYLSREEPSEKRKEYYKNNREKIIEQSKTYRKMNREKCNQYALNYYYRKKEMNLLKKLSEQSGNHIYYRE